MFFITKDFSKEIMKRSRLRNNFQYSNKYTAISIEIVGKTEKCCR